MRSTKRTELPAAAIVALVLLIPACDFLEPASEEIGRWRSPDGRVDAVFTKASGGATTAFVHRLFVVAAGQSTEEEEPKLLGDQFEGIAVSWRKDRFLDVHYSQGRIFRYQNFWSSGDLDEWNYVVEIRLIPPPEDFSLSDLDRQMTE